MSQRWKTTIIVTVVLLAAVGYGLLTGDVQKLVSNMGRIFGYLF